MAERINDGGPAFPTNGPDHGVYGAGMTLRDYFAAHVQVDITCIHVDLARKLTGREFPDPDKQSDWTPLAASKFWADAEAAYRYMRADAMLRAREVSHG